MGGVAFLKKAGVCFRLLMFECEQTYERASIQSSIASGSNAVGSTPLIPNKLVHSLITTWCANNAIDVAAYNSNEEDESLSVGDLRLFSDLKNKLSLAHSPIRSDAVIKLSGLIVQVPAMKVLLAESEEAVQHLVSALGSIDVKVEKELFEHTVTLLVNISNHNHNKWNAQNLPNVIQVVVDGLRAGTLHARGNAAATLKNMSRYDRQRTLFGQHGALGPLVSLFDEGGLDLAAEQAASAIYCLCVVPINVERAIMVGAIPVIIKKIKERVLVSSALVVLSILAKNRMAVDQIMEQAGIPILYEIMRTAPTVMDKQLSVSVLHTICNCDPSTLKVLEGEEITHQALSQFEGQSWAQNSAVAILRKLNLPPTV